MWWVCLVWDKTEPAAWKQPIHSKVSDNHLPFQHCTVSFSPTLHGFLDLSFISDPTHLEHLRWDCNPPQSRCTSLGPSPHLDPSLSSHASSNRSIACNCRGFFCATCIHSLAKAEEPQKLDDGLLVWSSKDQLALHWNSSDIVILDNPPPPCCWDPRLASLLEPPSKLCSLLLFASTLWNPKQPRELLLWLLCVTLLPQMTVFLFQTKPTPPPTLPVVKCCFFYHSTSPLSGVDLNNLFTLGFLRGSLSCKWGSYSFNQRRD